MNKKNLKREYQKKRRELKHTYRAEKRAIRSEYYDSVLSFSIQKGKNAPQNPPKRALIEEIGNAISHGIGTIFAIVVLVLMCFKAQTNVQYFGAAVYFAGMLAMFTVSCLYHAFRHGSSVKRLFRRFDYSSIYFMIGGTFAPILLAYSKSSLAIWFFAAQWLLIVTGVTFIGIYGPTRLKWLHFPLYALLGWCGVMFIPEMIARGDYLLFGLVLGGGVVYSIGVIPFAMKKSVAHFIWHLFVLAGAVIQWIGIYTVIY